MVETTAPHCPLLLLLLLLLLHRWHSGNCHAQPASNRPCAPLLVHVPAWLHLGCCAAALLYSPLPVATA
jgi:hypothetical protein